MPKDAGSGRPRIDKLGIKPGMSVCLIDVDVLGDDADLWRTELADRGATVSETPVDGCAVLIVAIEHRAHLVHISALRPHLARDGALWVLRPRGTRDITEAEVQHAGLDAGLVDVKVARFSDTHTAAKFVYRLHDR